MSAARQPQPPRTPSRPASRPPARQAGGSQPPQAGRVRVRYPLASPPGLSLEGFSRRAGLHPELTRRFVALGLLRATRDVSGNLRFEQTQLAVVARIQRLRVGLSLNYAAIGLVI